LKSQLLLHLLLAFFCTHHKFLQPGRNGPGGGGRWLALCFQI